MPLYGALDVAPIAARLPRVPHLDTEAWALPGAEVLQLAWEVGGESLRLLPRAMHPAIPPYVTVIVARYPESPVGPFLLGLVRLAGRAGAHPRGLVLGAVTSSAAAASALRERWGIPAVRGPVMLRRYHDRAIATVARDGETVLDVALVAPEPISLADVQYIASVTLADVVEDGQARPWLLQVDPHYTLRKAERGRPHVDRFVGAAWNADGLALGHPISASVTTSDTDLPQIRFVMDPEIPVDRGTRRIR